MEIELQLREQRQAPAQSQQALKGSKTTHTGIGGQSAALVESAERLIQGRVDQGVGATDVASRSIWQGITDSRLRLPDSNFVIIVSRWAV